MKTLGRGSLASAMKVLFDVLYYLSFVPAVGLLVLSVLMPVFHESENLTVHPRVLLHLDPDDHRVLPGVDSAPRVQIEKAVASLEVSGVSAGRMAIGLAVAWGLWTFMFVGLRKIREIFRTLKDGDPFVLENAARIRFLGFATIAFELLYRGAIFWMYFAFVANQFGITGVSLRPLFEPSLAVLGAGLMLIVVAEVFRVGAELRQDQELTI